MNERYAFLMDMTCCTGCKACMIACKDKNDLPLDVNWRRVVEYTGGSWVVDGDGFRQTVFSYYFSIACNHCRNPICVESCPTTAMNVDADGIVSVDSKRCIGCQYCKWACPYHAPQFDALKKVMTKCDFCKDLIFGGELPACVAACPTRALKFGTMAEFEAHNELSREVAPLATGQLTDPALYLKLHRNARPTGSKDGQIAAPEEI